MKTLVIGCNAETPMATAIAAEIGHDDILFIERIEDLPLGVRKSEFDQLIESHKIELMRSPKIPFYPKAKHCPKGHERPYKYHP